MLFTQGKSLGPWLKYIFSLLVSFMEYEPISCFHTFICRKYIFPHSRISLLNKDLVFDSFRSFFRSGLHEILRDRDIYLYADMHSVFW